MGSMSFPSPLPQFLMKIHIKIFLNDPHFFFLNLGGISFNYNVGDGGLKYGSSLAFSDF